MGQKTFDTILHLASVGYTVKFSRVEDFCRKTTLRIELQKGDKHHVELIDLNVFPVMKMNQDDLICRTLEKARWEFEYDFEREEKEL